MPKVLRSKVIVVRAPCLATALRVSSLCVCKVTVVHASPVPQSPIELNYHRKIYRMWATAKARAYSHIMSVDDDIIMSPRAIASMLRHPPRAELGGDDSYGDGDGDSVTGLIHFLSQTAISEYHMHHTPYTMHQTPRTFSLDPNLAQ